jgi:hypothetical protein
MKEKIDKKRISRGNQRISREKHHDQVVTQQISEERLELMVWDSEVDI